MKRSDSVEAKSAGYQPPSLVELGTLRELTQAGQTQPGGDSVFNGSVFPPGLED